MKGGISKKYNASDIDSKEISDGEIVPDEILSTNTIRN